MSLGANLGRSVMVPTVSIVYGRGLVYDWPTSKDPKDQLPPLPFARHFLIYRYASICIPRDYKWHLALAPSDVVLHAVAFSLC